MALEKALIQPLDEKGNQIGSPIKVLFNPTEYSIEKSNQFHTVSLPGKNAPVIQFVSGNAETLTMDLFFDTYETGEDVRTYTKQVVSLLHVDSKLHAPPVCKFVWGKLEFKAVLEKVTQRFTMFLGSGIPVRATLNVAFKEYRTITEQMESSFSDAALTMQLSLKAGMTLSMVADMHFGDPGNWRPIAKANRIANPRKLQAGMQIQVPPLE